jgi:transposase
MNSKLREKVVSLRVNENLSYSEIQKRFTIPKSTLSYWLKDIPLSEERVDILRLSGRKKAEAKIEKFRETMRVRRKYLQKVPCKI